MVDPRLVRHDTTPTVTINEGRVQTSENARHENDITTKHDPTCKSTEKEKKQSDDDKDKICGNETDANKIIKQTNKQKTKEGKKE